VKEEWGCGGGEVHLIVGGLRREGVGDVVKAKQVERVLGLPLFLFGLAHGVEVRPHRQQEVLEQLTRRNALSVQVKEKDRKPSKLSGCGQGSHSHCSVGRTDSRVAERSWVNLLASW